VAELVDAANSPREDRERLAADLKGREQSRPEREAAVAYKKRVEALALREHAVWQQLNEHIDAQRHACYDEAVRLLGDLQAVGIRSGRSDVFDHREAEPGSSATGTPAPPTGREAGRTASGGSLPYSVAVLHSLPLLGGRAA